MPVVEVGAAKIAYRVDGAGPGLVLVHGTGGNSETNWNQLVGRLSESRTVVRPDYSGSGATIDDGTPLTVAALAAQVVAAAENAGATPSILSAFPSALRSRRSLRPNIPS
jgi:pimeloyl-ACP methyl ester carboxylesterase